MWRVLLLCGTLTIKMSFPLPLDNCFIVCYSEIVRRERQTTAGDRAGAVAIRRGQGSGVYNTADSLRWAWHPHLTEGHKT